MQLKSLQIQGFKSFPDKTELIFGRGLTAVVGPNGSGKSNISDAVRWVLGEQSTRNLRGEKMEDVIFLGTHNRKPTGFASVSLTIDNTDRQLAVDADDVTITRRLYRSGESEYRINKTAVRLKDITELLMDTGLGRDGYSIIGQGRIEEIVSSKPGQRRKRSWKTPMKTCFASRTSWASWRAAWSRCGSSRKRRGAFWNSPKKKRRWKFLSGCARWSSPAPSWKSRKASICWPKTTAPTSRRCWRSTSCASRMDTRRCRSWRCRSTVASSRSPR